MGAVPNLEDSMGGLRIPQLETGRVSRIWQIPEGPREEFMRAIAEVMIGSTMVI